MRLLCTSCRGGIVDYQRAKAGSRVCADCVRLEAEKRKADAPKKLFDALMVILGSHDLAQHLRKTDPMAYTQAIEAVLQAQEKHT